MKILLFLCIVASLVHLGVQQYAYLTLEIPRLPTHSSGHVTIAVEFNYKPLKESYEDIFKPGSTIQSDVTVFLKNDKVLLNKNATVIPTDFRHPANVKTVLNNYVVDHTSGKINNFFKEFETTTEAVVLKCVDNWKVPDHGSSPYSVQLTGSYNARVNKEVGFTMIEIPKDKYVTALFILPDEGKEKSVKAAINSTNLAQWRKLLASQSINVEVPRATVYACAAIVFEKEVSHGFEYQRTKSSASIIATIP